MKIPSRVLEGQTTREWKSLKRQQFKTVIKALNDYRYGCAYGPSYENGNIEILEDIIDTIEDEHSIKAWGR
jgi:hypothetical protein